MKMRLVAILLLLSVSIAAEAMSHSFDCKATGRLGRTIRFEFYRDATKQPKTEVGSYLTVYRKAADGSWKAVEDFTSPGPAVVPTTTTP